MGSVAKKLKRVHEDKQFKKLLKPEYGWTKWGKSRRRLMSFVLATVDSVEKGLRVLK